MAPILDLELFFEVSSFGSIDALNICKYWKVIIAKAFTQDCGLVQGKEKTIRSRFDIEELVPI